MARLLAALPIILTKKQDKYCFSETAHIWDYSFLLCRGQTFTDYVLIRVPDRNRGIPIREISKFEVGANPVEKV
jgi:hypothetical protein